MTRTTRTRFAFAAAGVFVALALLAQVQAQKPATQAELLLGKALSLEEVSGKLADAIATYKQVLAAPDATRAEKARAQFRIGACHERLGQAEARKAYELVVANYGDQSEFAAQAKARLAVLTDGSSATIQPTTATTRLLWTSPGWFFARVSRDGRFVAYSDSKDDMLAIRDIASGSVRKLTAPSTSRNDVAGPLGWSRDGRFIAFSWFGIEVSEIRVVDVSSGVVQPIQATSGLNALVADWSPDGKSIVATGTVPTNEALALIPVSGGTPRVLATPGDACIQARFSPDGRFIAIGAVRGGEQGSRVLLVLPASGGEPSQVLGEEFDGRLIDWTPDGRALLAASARQSRSGLWRIPVMGGKPGGPPERLSGTAELGRAATVGVTDGGALFYTLASAPSETNLYVADVDLQNLRAIGELTDVGVGGLATEAPSWSPDGRFLAYFSRLSPRSMPYFVVRPLAGGVVTQFQMSLSHSPIWPPQWSADQRSVLANLYDRAGSSTLRRIDVRSGATEQVDESIPRAASGADSTGQVTSNPDGTVVYRRVNYVADGAVAVFRRDVARRSEQEIYRHPGRAGIVSAALSPDQESLAFILNAFGAERTQRTLVVVPARGGAGRTLWDFGQGHVDGSVSWTPDGRFVVVSYTPQPDKDPRRQVWLCPAAGGEPKPIEGLSMASVFGAIRVRPDGRQLAICGSQERATSEFRMLERFLPTGKALATVVAPAKK